MIDAINEMCRTWGAQKRYILTSKSQGWDGQSLMMKFKEMHDAAGSGTQRVAQFMEEGYTGEALLVARAMQDSPERLRQVLFVHYVPIKVKTPTRAHVLGLSVPEYWRDVDRLHYWIAARVPREADVA